MRWTTVRALCRRLTIAAVTLTMVTGSLPVGAFAEVFTTDSTFVQTDVDQVDAVDPADAAPNVDAANAADTAPDAGAADPTVLDTGDTPTPPDSEIASAAGLTGAGQTESTPVARSPSILSRARSSPNSRSRRRPPKPKQPGMRILGSG